MEQAKGRVVQIQGAVVDVEFPAGDLPMLYEALTISRASWMVSERGFSQ